MKKLLALCLALALSAALFAGCSGSPGGSSGTPANIVENGEITINLGSEPPMMNSILTTSTGSMNVLRHLMDGLTMLDQSDEAVPAAAESWTVSDDNLTYTFNIRKGVKWSNGEEVTAHDFIFAWDTLFTAETAAPYAGTWAPLILGALEKLEGTALTDDQQSQLSSLGYENGVGFKAIDDYTLQVTTTGPYPYFLSVLAFPSMFPVNEKAYNEIGSDIYGSDPEYLVTNGAFRMTSWDHESQIIIEKVADYWDASSIHLGKITMEMISDTNTALNAFKVGDLDMVGLTGEQTVEMRDEGRDVRDYDDGSAWYFEFNNSLPGLNNPKVRRALTLAVDAQLFIETVVKNDSKVANSFVPPAIQNGTFTAAAGDLLNRVTDGDYSAVKALFEEGLAEEGMTVADLKLSIILDEGDTAAKNGAFFQEQWKVNLGLEAAIEQMTYKNRLERMQNKDFSVVSAGWGPDYNDPMTFLDIFTSTNGNNHTWYANPEYDRLIAEAMVEPDATKRQNILLDAEKLLMTDMPIGPIYNRAKNYVNQPHFDGVIRTAFDDVNFRWAYVME